MYAKVFNNHNVHLKHQPDYDGDVPTSLRELVERIANDIDAPDVVEFQESCPHHELVLHVNGAPRLYFIDNEELEMFRNNRRIVLRYIDDEPLFTLPRFIDSYPFEHLDAVTHTRIPGTLFKFDRHQDISDEQWEQMLAAGCHRLRTQAQYAPEIQNPAVFVPKGVPFDYTC